MTECHTNPIEFARAGRKNVVADFLGGQITTDAGTLLLREVHRKLNLSERVSRLILAILT